MLVNVASYARERMPHGGRLKIELATVVVDSRFIAKYPNVRPGAPRAHHRHGGAEHRAADAADQADARTAATAEAAGSSSDKPGVDLGALLGLISECGGHLWMAAEPPGNMVLKIHLPTRASTEPPDPRAQATLAGRGRNRWPAWFRH